MKPNLFFRRCGVLASIILISAAHGILASQTPPSVTTGQYDNGRTGANLAETILTPANVSSHQFGLLFTRPVDGAVYAQPLYLPGVRIHGNVQNVVFVATLNNSVYAFDADDVLAIVPLWQVNLGTPVVFKTGGMVYLGTECGILSTPVIDTASNTIFVLALTQENGNRVHRLHALDIRTGQEKFGGPVQIQGSVPGRAPDAVGGTVTFSSANQLQRPALLLSGASVKVLFGPANEDKTYHGWAFTYDATTLAQQSVWCTTPNGTGGGIWMSGRGPAADSHGTYFMVANGTATGGNYGETAIRQTAQSLDYFLPDNAPSLTAHDWDLGAGGPLLIPHSNLLVGGGKTGTMFVLDRTNLGKYAPGNSQVVQTWQATAGCPSQAWNGCDEIHHTAYWERSGGAAPLLYLWAWESTLNAYAFNGNTFNTTPAATNPAIANYPGGILAISANGGQAGTGILWAAMSAGDSSEGPVPGTLRAFDAASLTELWNSTMDPLDNYGLLAKFCVPTVVNGKVYVATFSNQLAVYGLR